ncbi:MAG: hypothetical protein EOP50_05530 [Sphingobacteriales bacterium]|nr:MAG: hypothetical protein EOP50_05530 [Sphingobacteriales bacterium]
MMTAAMAAAFGEFSPGVPNGHTACSAYPRADEAEADRVRADQIAQAKRLGGTVHLIPLPFDKFLTPTERAAMRTPRDATIGAAITKSIGIPPPPAPPSPRDIAIDAEVKRLGAHRRAEAERIVSMREAADAARIRSVGTRQPPQTVAQPAPKLAMARDEQRMCKVPAASWSLNGIGWTIEASRQDARNGLAKACNGNTPGTALGAIICDKPRTLKLAKGKLQSNVMCRVRYSCPAYERACPSQSKPVGARSE